MPKRRVDGLASPAVHAPEREARMGDEWSKWERAAGEGRNALTFARPRARGWCADSSASGARKNSQHARNARESEVMRWGLIKRIL